MKGNDGIEDGRERYMQRNNPCNMGTPALAIKRVVLLLLLLFLLAFKVFDKLSLNPSFLEMVEERRDMPCHAMPCMHQAGRSSKERKGSAWLTAICFNAKHILIKIFYSETN